ncbi:MAG TPA: hypothetical protein VGE07_18715 [Herpetosiphonaceae bacterium]
MARRRRLLSAGLLLTALAACSGDIAPPPTVPPPPTIAAAPAADGFAYPTPLPTPPDIETPLPTPDADTSTPLPTINAAPAGAEFGSPTATPPFPERQITAATVDQIRLLRTVGFGRARVAALSPDKQRLAVATSAGLAFFTYPGFGHIRFDRFVGGVETVAWGAEGVTVDATVSALGIPGEIQTIDANTGQVLKRDVITRTDPQYPVTVTSPDGSTQAVFKVPDASPTPGVRISRGGQDIYADEQTTNLAFSTDGALAVMVTYDGLVRVRDLAAGVDNELNLPGFWGAAFSADGQRLLASERQLTVWDVVSGAQLSSAPIDAAKEPWVVGAVQRIRHRPDGSALLIDGEYIFFEGSQRVGDLWSAGPQPQLQSTVKIASFGIANYETYAGAISPDGTGAATTDGAALEFYDAPGNIAATVDVPERIAALEYAPDGGLLAVATLPGPIKLLGADHQPAGGYASDQPIEAMRFSSDGGMLAGLGRDGALRIWRRGAEQPALIISGVAEAVGASGDPALSLVFTADGGMVGVANGAGLRFYSLSDGALLHSQAEPALSVDVGPRQRAIAVLRDGYVELWGLE